MDFLIAVAALAFLMFIAYRGFSVILFAPVAAMGAVLLTDPSAVPPVFTGVFMDKLVGFVKLYFPVFLLGAVFGKVIELSGFSKSIVRAVIGLVGRQRAMLAIVLVCAVLTYGGVSLFVVVFAAYPFAAEMFRQSGIPKRLIPGTIALGAFTFTMDSLPGTPQIQNIIPTTFFRTDTWAAPVLGTIGSAFILAVGLAYLEWRRRSAAAAGEGYGEGHTNEPEPADEEALPHPAIAILPLVAVGVLNKLFTSLIAAQYGARHEVTLAGMAQPLVTQVPSVAAIWAVLGALLVGILTVLAFAYGRVARRFAEGSKAAVGGALLASMNTAAEYGFGAVIAALPGFLVIREALRAVPNPLVNEAVSVTVLAGITGSASGGMSIALAAMADQFIAGAEAAGIPLEVLHRVASMASGGMDTLPHNGAVITLLAVTGLTHRQAYGDIFAITLTKTAAVFVVIAVYYLTGIT
ncbi:GntP family permease [Belnapia sp. T18]|uniref:GntP family permease n=1 Tax=Belnapia arida TaxID=2804533 RepID=A0ABS1UA04_9PROT|nr:GntP family permease [Belnapia arida]MBL6081501.1 GntP family permease [Belnapia arida]